VVGLLVGVVLGGQDDYLILEVDVLLAVYCYLLFVLILDVFLLLNTVLEDPSLHVVSD